MKVYVDLVLFINFFFDLILLVCVSLLLRRTTKLNRLIFAAFLGSLSVFLLFVKMNSFTLFLFKVVISIIMCLVGFGFRDIRYTLKNLFFLYTTSMILGGALYFLNTQFSYKQEGLVFYNNGFSINLVVLGILSPIILYTYVRQGLQLKNHYHDYYKITITFPTTTISCSAFLDTGNQLTDPYFGKPVILLYHRDTHWQEGLPFCMVPLEGASGNGLLKCITASDIEIEGIGKRTQVMVGLMEKKIHIDGVDCILHTKIMEG